MSRYATGGVGCGDGYRQRGPLAHPRPWRLETAPYRGHAPHHRSDGYLAFQGFIRDGAGRRVYNGPLSFYSLTDRGARRIVQAVNNDARLEALADAALRVLVTSSNAARYPYDGLAMRARRELLRQVRQVLGDEYESTLEALDGQGSSSSAT